MNILKRLWELEISFGRKIQDICQRLKLHQYIGDAIEGIILFSIIVIIIMGVIKIL